MRRTRLALEGVVDASVCGLCKLWRVRFLGSGFAELTVDSTVFNSASCFGGAASLLCEFVAGFPRLVDTAAKKNRK